jgi:hypothetical protein
MNYLPLACALFLSLSAQAGLPQPDAFDRAVGSSELPYSFVKANEAQLRALAEKVEAVALDRQGAGWSALVKACSEYRGGDDGYVQIRDALPQWVPAATGIDVDLATDSRHGGVVAINGLTVSACDKFRTGMVCYEKTYSLTRDEAGVTFTHDR